MKRTNWMALVGVFVLILTADRASAAPITYTWWGLGSGSLGNHSFAGALVTFNYYADTGDTESTSGGTTVNYYNESGTATVTIPIEDQGTVTATFTGSYPMAAMWTGISGYVLLEYRDPSSEYPIGVSGDVLPDWDFLSPVGPVTGNSLFSPRGPYMTTDGEFSWSDDMDFGFATPFTFQATTGNATVPEPASVLLLGAGLGALALRKPRR